MMRGVVLFCACLAPTHALNTITPTTRRAVLSGLGGGAAWALTQPAHARGEATAEVVRKAAIRQEAERVAALPESRIKFARRQLTDAASFLEQQEWYQVRGEFADKKRPLSTIRKLPDELKFSGDISGLLKDLLANIREVDEFAYNEQLSPRIARGCIGLCLTPEQLEKPRAALKAAQANLDGIIAMII